jgi:hypothetical protein
VHTTREQATLKIHVGVKPVTSLDPTQTQINSPPYQSDLTQHKRPTKALFTSPVFSPPKDVGDMWEFGIHLILSNPLKYSFLKILYHEALFGREVSTGFTVFIPGPTLKH